MIFILAGNIPALAAPVPTANKDAAKPQEIIKKQITNMPEKTPLPQAIEKPKPNEAQKNAANDLREQAKFLYNSNKLNESLELFSKIPDTEKISDDWLFLANIAQDNNKEIDAVFFLKKAIQADDKNYKAHYNLGNIYFSDNKINMALNEYRKVLRIKKDYAYAYNNKGCCYLKKKSCTMQDMNLVLQ